MDTTGLDEIPQGEGQQSVARDPAQEEPAVRQAEDAAPPTGDDAAAKPAEREESERMAPLEALLAERVKRQAAEMLGKDLERQNQPDPDKDPEAWRASVRTEIVNQRIDLSFDLAKQTIPDFDATMKSWEDVLAKDPTAYDRAVSSRNPAETAYDMVKQHLSVKEVGDPTKYRERLKAEILEEIKKEQQSKPHLPSSLALAPNTAGRGQPQFEGPTPLQSLFSNN